VDNKKNGNLSQEGNTTEGGTVPLTKLNRSIK